LNITDAKERQPRCVSHRRISNEVENGSGRGIGDDVGLEKISAFEVLQGTEWQKV
jgi:hypothetical protein